jgi:hypothetical protein
MSARSFPLHAEATALVHAPIDRVFAYLDDPRSLSAHMGESSTMMMGSRMAIETDDGQGRAIGSKIRMYGRMLGIDLSLEEVITEREPPSKKTWETVGTPRLMVIDHYRMGFELTPERDASRLRVFIDYGLPARVPGSWLGRLLGGFYARWCAKRMAEDAAKHFEGHSGRAAATGPT